MKSITQNKYTAYWLFPLFIILLMGSCSSPVVKIDKIPENTPPGAGLYIAGNFNRWDAGDVRYRFEMGADSNYYYTLPSGFGKIEFKITRGEWSSEETDSCGYIIGNRSLDYNSADTLTIEVLSWKDTDPVDCPELTIVIDKLPEGTPTDEPIALAGNFNEWSPDSASYLKKDSNSGKYMIRLPRKDMDRLIEFKVTRGNLLTAEVDQFGYEIEKRQIKFGLVDTLFIDVENWEDIVDVPKDRVTIIIDKIPAETPSDASIFLTGSFNGWYPRDSKYKFSKNEKGKFQYILPRESDIVEFKVTRGDWSKEEVDIFGYKMNNRKFEFGSADTLHLTIHGWLDQTKVTLPTYTILIEDVPKNTPTRDPLFLAGSINSWKPDRRKFEFTRMENGKYFLTLRDAWRSMDYKITRGSWNTLEADDYGFPLANRLFEFTGQDTVKIKIKNWVDIPKFDQKKVVIFLEEVPENTPEDQHIFITGTFNNWNPGDPDYILNKNLKGQYYTTVPRRGKEMEFKFTLGNWDFEELNSQGQTIENRKYNFGYMDTLRLKVEKWEGVR